MLCFQSLRFRKTGFKAVHTAFASLSVPEIDYTDSGLQRIPYKSSRGCWERLKNLRSFIQDRRAALGKIVPNIVPRLRQIPAPAPVPDTTNVSPPVPTSPKTTRFNRFMRRLRPGTPRSTRTEDFRTPLSDQSDLVSPSDSFQSADSHVSEPNTPINPSRSDLVRRLSYSPFCSF